MAKEPQTRVTNTAENEVTPLNYQITSYGADYPVDALVTRLQAGDIFVPPFQRKYVWTTRRASRFVESLLLGLPVPGIFLSREEESGRLLVIDGQQRIRTLQYFYEGIFEPTARKFILKGTGGPYEGMSIKTLPRGDRRRLSDSIIHATVIRQDSPRDDSSSVYSVFERLNTESDQLRPQEIRATIYHGALNNLLHELNEDAAWRDLFGAPEKRMRDQELILRFLAMREGWEHYHKPMTAFLNRFMLKHQDLDGEAAEELSRAFRETVAATNEGLGSAALRPRRSLNAAVFDAVMVAMHLRLCSSRIEDLSSVRRAYDHVMGNKEFAAATERATSDEEAVKTRISIACDAFGRIR